MTQTAAVVHSRASINVRAIVLPRATWETGRGPDFRIAFRPQKGTWYGHVVRGRWNVTVIPLLSCPSCAGVSTLAHTEEAAAELRKLLGMPVPVSHSIDSLGRVSPDVMCGHGRKSGSGSCDFHRKAYLDRWNKTKALYAIAYIDLNKGDHGQIEIAYSHSIDAREARFHLGAGKFRILGSGPAIGLFVDEKTGRVTTD